LIPDTQNRQLGTAQPDSERIIFKFAVEPQASNADDPFIQWLRDKKSVGIDWSNYGIEKLHSNEPR
jgi:hypothetical protein